MEALRHNPCKITETWKLHHEYGDELSDLVIQNISPDLQYSCSYWAQHFSHSRLSDQLTDDLEKFFETSMMFWLEVCCLLGVVHEVLLTTAKVVQKVALVSLISIIPIGLLMAT